MRIWPDDSRSQRVFGVTRYTTHQWSVVPVMPISATRRNPNSLIHGSPQVGQGASLALQVSTLNATLTRKHHEPLQLGEVHPMGRGLVEVFTVLSWSILKNCRSNAWAS